MSSTYDEDLNSNPFIVTLKKDYPDQFYKIISEGCAICVPRVGCFPSYAITLDDILSHVIVPHDEMPESHFQTLTGWEVKISNRTITATDENGCQFSAHILFEETYYTEDFHKYKIYCIENSLESKTDGTQDGVLELRTLRDCIDFLLTEGGGRHFTENIEKNLEEFFSSDQLLEEASLQTLRDLVSGYYKKCLQAVFQNRRLYEKARLNNHITKSIRVAVETYVHHHLYKDLFRYISSSAAMEEGALNKAIRNSMDIQLRDLDIRAEFHDLIPKARAELGKLGGYSTVLGKINCLRKMFLIIAKDPESGGMLVADDLLPIVIFLVIKAGITNWCAHLAYLKSFRFSNPDDHAVDEDYFLITTLEASLEHIKSGVFTGPLAKEHGSSPTPLSHLFNQAAEGNVEEVKKLLTNDKQCLDYSNLNFCHPLCNCAKCLEVVQVSSPTINSCDDLGRTVLHIGATYGRPDIIDYILSKNGNQAIADEFGRTPLHYAALYGHQHALLLLAQSGAYVNVPDNDFNTALHLSCLNGHEGCVKALIYHCEHERIRILINAQNHNGDTPLHFASKFGYLNIVSILIDYRADPSILNRAKMSSSHIANNSKVVKILSRAKSRVRTAGDIESICFDFVEEDPDVRVVRGDVPSNSEDLKKVEKTLLAISCGDVNLACYYLNLNSLSTKKQCHHLCNCGNCRRNEPNLVLNGGKIHVNMCDSEGNTPLHMAATQGCLDLAQLLVKKHALLDVQTRTKHLTPLMMAVQNQRVQVAKFLLDMGCMVDLQDVKGNTALHYACIKGHRRLVDSILSREPNSALRNRRGNTALQEAEIRSALGIVNMLREYNTNTRLH